MKKKKKHLKEEQPAAITGVFTAHPRGFGFVGDVYIHSNNINGAMNKDTVMITVDIPRGGTKKEGRVVKILKRGSLTQVGTFCRFKRYAAVIPDDNKNAYEIIIPKKHSTGLADGAKVVVHLTKLPGQSLPPEGKVIKILGHKNDPTAEIMSIVYSHDIPAEYPDEVLAEIQNIPDEVRPDELDGRRDLTNSLLITIDGEDTKDIDDAVSIKKTEAGWRLGVHIADVTHYVREGSALDKEALNRGTSVYPPGCVIPMLPHKLSNGICSLNEDAPRLALSCVMEIDNNGDVVAYDIFPSFIKVSKRFTYTEVNEIIKYGATIGSGISGCGQFESMLHQARELSDVLKEKRRRRGAIDFGIKETHIITDGQGKPVDVKPHDRNAATELIEEFMIVCNETVAAHHKLIPFVFRCHEQPDQDKLMALNEIITVLGYSLKPSGGPKQIQRLLAKAEGTPEEALINRLVLTSLRQARYVNENLGHFGLASRCYCHFTSPIRRYPDLIIHRIIKENLAGGLSKNRSKHYGKILSKVSDQCSMAERRAVSCEREAVRLMTAEYMKDKTGCVFDAVISGVTHWGLFMELENTVECLVPAETMDSGLVYDQARQRLAWDNGQTAYCLGQSVSVRITDVNVNTRRITAALEN